jgi:hypothetical protein
LDPDPGGQHGSTGSGSTTREETQQEGICLNAAAGECAGSTSHNVFSFLKKNILARKVKCVLGINYKKRPGVRILIESVDSNTTYNFKKPENTYRTTFLNKIVQCTTYNLFLLFYVSTLSS